MEIILSTTSLLSNNLTPNQASLLFLLYYKKYEDIANIYGKQTALDIRNSLINTKYLLSENTKFVDTLISKKEVEKLFSIKPELINFWEFYNCYPTKVGSRVLRAVNHTSEIAKKHEKKYLNKVRTVEKHNIAIKAIESYVAKQKQTNKLQFLPNMETVMNNSMWEQWEVFIQELGVEEKEWNSDTI